jgi:hypothetical protein
MGRAGENSVCSILEHTANVEKNVSDSKKSLLPETDVKQFIKSNTMSKFGNSEFTMKPTYLYNLDMIISVGYRRTIGEHIKNVFKEGELEERVVCRNFRHTTQHGAWLSCKIKTMIEKIINKSN